MIRRIQCTFLLFSVLLTGCASSSAEKPPELIGQADALISQGVTQYKQANYAKADQLFELALSLYRSIDNPQGTASAYINLAKSALSQNHVSNADQWLQRAQQIIDLEQLSSLQSHIIITRSSIAIEKNDWPAAKALLAPLLNESSNGVNAETHLAAVQNRTRIAFAQSDSANEWAEKYARLVDDNNLSAHARLARFRAALSTDSVKQDEYYQVALNINRKLAYRPGIAATLSEWAEQNISIKNYPGAQNKLERALLIRLDLHDNYNSALILQQLEMVYGKLGQTTKQRLASDWSSRASMANFNEWEKVIGDIGN